MENLRILGLLILALCTAGISSCQKSNTSTDTTSKTENLPDISGYPIVGTDQTNFYNNSTVISEPWEVPFMVRMLIILAQHLIMLITATGLLPIWLQDWCGHNRLTWMATAKSITMTNCLIRMHLTALLHLTWTDTPIGDCRRSKSCILWSCITEQNPCLRPPPRETLSHS